MNGEKALEQALESEVKRDASFTEKCNYHQNLMIHHNTTGKSPMELAETPEGQAVLDGINARVSSAMTAKYGE
jgi:hypothetical protein